MKGIILHAGHGTRLRPLTHTGPKQLLPIANKPMSEYCIESLKDANVTDIAIVIGGIGSIKGAFVGALLVGITDTMGRFLLPSFFSYFFDTASATSIGSSIASMSIYILMAIVLIFKPSGLYGLGK